MSGPGDTGRPSPDTGAEIDALVRRLDALGAERAIVEVLQRHCEAIDDGDADAWAELYTEDGVWEVIGPAARIDVRLAGHAELRNFAAHHTRAPDAWHKHCFVTPRVVVDGDRASSTCYSFRLDGFADGPVVQSFGRYLDRFVRDPDGRWLIAHHQVVVESTRPSPFGYIPPST